MAKLTTIIARLWARTNASALDWQVADGSESSVAAALGHYDSSVENYEFDDADAFYVKLPNGSVVLHLDSDNDMIITLLDDEDSVLEQVNIGYSHFSEYKAPVEALYDSVRRNALGIDERLDNLLKDLQ